MSSTKVIKTLKSFDDLKIKNLKPSVDVLIINKITSLKGSENLPKTLKFIQIGTMNGSVKLSSWDGVEGFPESLEEIHIMHSKLTSLPDKPLKHLVNLKNLSLVENNIDNFKGISNIPDNLELLNLQHNPLSTWDEMEKNSVKKIDISNTFLGIIGQPRPDIQ
jgi:Leucine-rich repeat (LRR) protein